jgi:hypothetical protein
MLEPDVLLDRQHNTGGTGQPGQQARGFGQHGLGRLGGPGGRDLRVDRLPVAVGQGADLHQRVDEEAQAQFGREAARRSMRRIHETELLKVGHHVAHRSRRQRHRDDARQIARADRFAGGKITLDDPAEDLARPVVELRQSGLRRADLGRPDWYLVGQ